MKKLISVAIIAIFIFSLMPLAFAQESAVAVTADVNIGTNDKRENARDRLQDMREKNKERLEKMQNLDQEQIKRLSALNVKNIDKIAQLKKERLDRISKLSEEKLLRISELDKENLEKVADLSDVELEKVSVLGRARLKALANKDDSRMKAELKSIRIVKLKGPEGLNKRIVSQDMLIQLKEKLDKSRDEFRQAKSELEDSRKKLREAKDRRDENATFEYAQSYLLHTADALINHLEKIKANVQASENIEADSESKIVAQIDAQIAEINSIKAQISAATSREQLKEAAKKMQDKWSRLKHLISAHAERVVTARIEGIVNRGIVLEKRLDKILAKAKEKGIEINVSAEVGEFSAKIATAKDKYQQAQAKLTAVIELKTGNSTNEQIKAAANDAKSLLKEARDAIKEAHGILKEIVGKIKEAYPEANLSEEAEVEVAVDKTATASTEANATVST